MKPLTFTLKAATQQRLDLSPLTPARLKGLSAKEIGRIAVETTKEKIAAGDLFQIGGADPSNIHIIGGLDRFDGIGAGMASGSIFVEGDAGARLGRAMSGGAIRITGSAGVWCGSGMKAGRIDIRRNAGDWIGGPLAGEMAGMSGGFIHVKGDAGAEAGHRLRRGTIAIGGNAGAYAGRAMIAGTLAIGGDTAHSPGYLMKRGTILIGGKAARLSGTFLDCGEADLAFLRLLERSLMRDGVKPGALFKKPKHRWAGDTAVIGKGEIFV
jgi:formylmethanofuran dehydrogenase subunit C